MSNKRFILLFLVGIAACIACLWGLSVRARVVATDSSRRVLCPVEQDRVTDIMVTRDGAHAVVKRDAAGWRLVEPYPSAAHGAAVARLLDVMTLMPLADMRTDDELRRMGETLADFGLHPSRAKVTLVSAGRTNVVHFGSATASGEEVYARVEGVQNVFTVPRAALDAVPEDADAIRPRSLFSCPKDEIAGIEFRAPDAPFVKLVRQGSVWRIAAPADAPADDRAVGALADTLAASSISGFTLPSAAFPPPAEVSPGSVLPTAALAPYGLAADAGLSVTVRAADGKSETVLFGASAGTNLVWALVGDGTAVVTVDAKLAELCRAREASFRDTRVFAFAQDETLTSVSLSVGALVYVLGRAADGAWRLEAPVVAPADPATAAALVENVLKLKQSDLAPEKDPSAIRVAVATSAGSRPGVAVRKTYFGPEASFADIRSKTMLTLDPATVRRLSVKKADGEVAVVLDAARATWRLEHPVAGRRTRESAVKDLLAALARVEASGVETVAATPSDFRRCGLDAPYCVVTADVEASETARWNVLLGGVAPGGGRYATVGGADAVFVVPRQTVTALAADLTE